MTEVIAKRQFDPLYIWLDVLFLCVFALLLLWRKKYTTVLVGLFAGLLYMAVDYGIFHLLCGAREISDGYSLFWVLLWISKDRHLFEWSLLILSWWFCCPLLTQTFGGGEPIVIQRTTGAYHGYMALILFAGYFGLIVWNLSRKNAEEKAPVLWLLIIGILVQFGWEAMLLIGGIRSAGFSGLEKLSPLLVNSLLETNLGMPYVYLLFLLYSSRFTEQCRRRKTRLTLKARIAENNAERARTDAAYSAYLDE